LPRHGKQTGFLFGHDTLSVICSYSVQSENTGYVELFGRENIYRGTERVFESILEAEHDARKWIREQEKLEVLEEEADSKKVKKTNTNSCLA